MDLCLSPTVIVNSTEMFVNIIRDHYKESESQTWHC
jgi:hypothetical protein